MEFRVVGVIHIALPLRTVAVGILLIGYCNAEATIDLQLHGCPPVSIPGFSTFQPSPLVSVDMHEFLLQQSTAFMVLQGHLAAAGDPSEF